MKYYSLVDLLVYPRKAMRLTELVTPLKPLEAMAQGMPLLPVGHGGWLSRRKRALQQTKQQPLLQDMAVHEGVSFTVRRGTLVALIGGRSG